MVERIYQEKQIIYENSGSNPWYTLLDKIADAIVELCGAEITNKGSGNVTLTIPEFPGVLYMTATSGTSSGYFYMYLRGKDSSRNLFDTYSAYISSQKGSVTVGYTSIGGFLNCIFFGPTALPNEDYWCAAWWGWFINTTTNDKVYNLYQRKSSGNYRKKKDVNGAFDTFGYLWMDGDSACTSTSLRSPKQTYYNYPSNPDASILSPIYIFTDYPKPGMCKWGGQYMLFNLNRRNSDGSVPTQPDMTYNVNGKKYLACGSTLLIPEPWPFIEEGE